MARKKPKDYKIEVADDGRFRHKPAGEHTVQKHRRLGIYAELLTTGMKNKWDHRVFIDLFAGPGHCGLKESGKIVCGSPLVALSVPDPFDLYVLCESQSDAMSALKERVGAMGVDADVRFVSGDVNDSSTVDEVVGHLPARSEKALYLCFVDPYSLAFDFQTIKQLASARRVDFIVNLALGTDGNRNLEYYYTREGNNRIEKLLDDPDCRLKWSATPQAENKFLAARFSAAMESIGYQPVSFDRMCPVRTARGALLYYLALYTKDQSQIANKFWDATLKYSDDQIPLF